MKINSVTPHSIRATSKRLSRAVKLSKLMNGLEKTKKIAKCSKEEVNSAPLKSNDPKKLKNQKKQDCKVQK